MKRRTRRSMVTFLTAGALLISSLGVGTLVNAADNTDVTAQSQPSRQVKRAFTANEWGDYELILRCVDQTIYNPQYQDTYEAVIPELAAKVRTSLANAYQDAKDYNSTHNIKFLKSSVNNANNAMNSIKASPNLLKVVFNGVAGTTKYGGFKGAQNRLDELTSIVRA